MNLKMAFKYIYELEDWNTFLEVVSSLEGSLFNKEFKHFSNKGSIVVTPRVFCSSIPMPFNKYIC
jgi:hypothetical protein